MVGNLSPLNMWLVIRFQTHVYEKNSIEREELTLYTHRFSDRDQSLLSGGETSYSW